MREIEVTEITKFVAELCISSCIVVAPDIKQTMKAALGYEDGTALQVINDMLKNQEIAFENRLPICQDTGMVVVFLEVGQDVHFVGGNIEDAVQEGVRKGYDEGYLRKSVVEDPVHRKNTNDNTPAVVYYEIVAGENVKITVAPKGFGSENMSRLKMLIPSDGIEVIKQFIVETVTLADSNACPPIIVGVGVGGTFEKCAVMAKKALLRKIGSKHTSEYWANIEQELLHQINATGIGPAGLGGMLTAMAVHINTYATHIAGLPLAVNIGCHVNRHEEIIL